jgi:predicted Zn finger-like uncharacterized protein
MSLEIQCPNCGAGYVVEASALGADFFCAACASPVPLDAIEAAVRREAPAAEPPPQEATVHGEVVCPRCQLHFNPGKHRKAAMSTAGRPTVLIVEDLGYFRQIAQETLASDYEIKTAGSLTEAQRILGEGGIDLMLLDIALGDGDQGMQLLRDSAIKPCPILIFTEQDESEMYGDRWEELQELGADDIVIKGINVAESLWRKVGTLLGRQIDDEANP